MFSGFPCTVTTICRVCRDKDKVVVNYAELKHSADLAECFSEQQSPNLTLISEYGLYRILPNAICRELDEQDKVTLSGEEFMGGFSNRGIECSVDSRVQSLRFAAFVETWIWL